MVEKPFSILGVETGEKRVLLTRTKSLLKTSDSSSSFPNCLDLLVAIVLADVTLSTSAHL